MKRTLRNRKRRSGFGRMVRGERGAITVFLVIILVPCIVVTSIFVDASRVKYVEGLSASSADLALNSVLTQYDPDLQKLYGLMASSKSTDDAINKATQYYYDMMKSGGHSDAAAQSVADAASDLLKAAPASATPEAPIIAKAHENANLANTALLRNQISEFMKYRAPIDIGRTLLGLFKDMGDQAETLRDSENDKEIIKQKQEYFEALEKLIDTLKTIYKTLHQHETMGYFSSYDGWWNVNYDIRLGGSFDKQLQSAVHPFFMKYGIQNLHDPEVILPGGQISKDEYDGASVWMQKIEEEIADYRDNLESDKERLDDIKKDIGELQGLVDDVIKQKDEWSEQCYNGKGDELSPIAQANVEEIEGVAGDKQIASMLQLVNDLDSDPTLITDLGKWNEQVFNELDGYVDMIEGIYYGIDYRWNDKPSLRGNLVDYKNGFDDGIWKGAFSNVGEVDGYFNISERDVTSGDGDLDTAENEQTTEKEWYVNMTQDGFEGPADDDGLRYEGQIGDAYRYGFSESGPAKNTEHKNVIFAEDRIFKILKKMTDDDVLNFLAGDEEGTNERGAKEDMKERDKNEEEAHSAEKIIETLEEVSENVQTANAGMGGEFPSGFNNGEGANPLADFIGLATGFASKGWEKQLLDIRDALYSAEYAKGMFSYYTIEQEETYRLEDDSLEKGKSLTGADIKAENNVGYRSELEYILFGGTNGLESVGHASADIYGIRFMLNVPSAFLNFYVTPATRNPNPTGALILTMATAAQGATGGLVPYQVFQCVFLLALAAVESGIDVAQLLGGHAVVLYKAEKDWSVSMKTDNFEAINWEDKMPNIDERAGGEQPEKESNVKDGKLYLFYSDYLYIFLLMGYAGGNADVLYQRTGDLIQGNIMHQGGADFRMSNATVYFRLQTELKVSPMMLALPITDGYTPPDLDSWSYWKVQENMVRGYQ